MLLHMDIDGIRNCSGEDWLRSVFTEKAALKPDNEFFSGLVFGDDVVCRIERNAAAISIGCQIDGWYIII
jgi:hypothetical protein